MVNVLPLPVCPKAKMQQLKPRRNAAASGAPARANTSSCRASPSATHVKAKERARGPAPAAGAAPPRPPTEMDRPSADTLVTALLASPPPRTRQYTRMLSPAASSAMARGWVAVRSAVGGPLDDAFIRRQFLTN